MLDAYMPEPSPTPVGSPLPPVTLEESTRVPNKFYVKQKDSDPVANGIGWTPGAKDASPLPGSIQPNWLTKKVAV